MRLVQVPCRVCARPLRNLEADLPRFPRDPYRNVHGSPNDETLMRGVRKENRKNPTLNDALRAIGFVRGYSGGTSRPSALVSRRARRAHGVRPERSFSAVPESSRTCAAANAGASPGRWGRRSDGASVAAPPSRRRVAHLAPRVCSKICRVASSRTSTRTYSTSRPADPRRTRDWCACPRPNHHPVLPTPTQGPFGGSRRPIPAVSSRRARGARVLSLSSLSPLLSSSLSPLPRTHALSRTRCSLACVARRRGRSLGSRRLRSPQR